MRYPYCKECNRDMRPRKAAEEDHPNTVQRMNQDICRSCYAHIRRVGGEVTMRGLRDPAAHKNRPVEIVKYTITPEGYTPTLLRGIYMGRTDDNIILDIGEYPLTDWMICVA